MILSKHPALYLNTLLKLKRGKDSPMDAVLEYILPSWGSCVTTYETGNDIPYAASPGSLQILEIDKVSGYVWGKFSAGSAGFYDKSHKYAGTIRIEGEFVVLFFGGDELPEQNGNAYNKLKRAMERNFR